MFETHLKNAHLMHRVLNPKNPTAAITWR